MDALWLLIKYAFLGILQGFTEPIPISSSGHLVIGEHLFHIEMNDFSLEILTNFASLLAVLLIYRRDLFRLIINGTSYLTSKNGAQKHDFQFIMYLIIGTIPAAVLGLLFNDFLEQHFKNVKMVGITLIITGIALWLIRNLRGGKNDASLTMKDAIIVGLAQAVALIPGISRSGATIVAAMGLGMKQETALRYSFLLYIPISVGTMILGVSDFLDNPQFATLWIPYTVAFLLSFIASYFSLLWLMNMMAKGNLKIFAFYCFIVGPLAFFFL